MTNIKKAVFKESKKIFKKQELDITPEELANLALFKIFNLPYFENVHNFLKMNYNVFDEICLGMTSLNNVKGYSNETTKSFMIRMNPNDKHPDEFDLATQILDQNSVNILQSFLQITNTSKNLEEIVKKVEKKEIVDPFYLSKLMNITGTSSHEGNKLIRAISSCSNYKEADTYAEYQFEQTSKMNYYRGYESINSLRDFVYNNYTFKEFSKKSFEHIMESINQRDINDLTGITSLFKEDLENFHQTHPHEYDKSIFKIFKEIPDSDSRCKAVFNLMHYAHEVNEINQKYKNILKNFTCEQLINKYDDYIQPIVQSISKIYPQLNQNVSDSPYEIKRFTHKTYKEKLAFLKIECPLEIFQDSHSQLEYQSIRGLLFYKDQYQIDKGFYISANNGLEDIAGASGYFMDNLSFSSIRLETPNIRVSRVYDTGIDIDINIKKALLEESVKIAIEANCPFVYDIIEGDKGHEKFNNEMKICIAALKEQYQNVIFLNDCIRLNEKEYLESNIKSQLLHKLFELKTPYNKIVSANKSLEQYFKTNEFSEISQLDYLERTNSQKIKNKITEILSKHLENKNKFSP